MDDQDKPTITKLLSHLDSHSGFIGFDASAQTIISIDEDDDDSVKKITSTILHDSAVTTHLLHLANSSSRSGQNVSTIDQVIAILGQKTVKTVVESLAHINTLPNKHQSNQLHAEIVAGHFCGTLASEITRHNAPRFNSQEAHVCGLLQNLGRVTALYHQHDEIERIHALQVNRNITEEDAVAQIFNMQFDDIGAAIAGHYNFPDALQQSIGFKLTGKAPPRPAGNALGWHQLCSLFARRITDALFRMPEHSGKIEVTQDIAFFRQALLLKDTETNEWIEKALEETRTLIKENALGCDIEQVRGLLRKASERAVDLLSPQDRLTQINHKADGKKPVEVIQQAIRHIHDEFNFDLTLLCLPNGTSGLVAIAGIGRNATQVAAKFRCQGQKPDIFRLIMNKKVDLYVPDVNASSYAQLMPDWYRQLVGAQSFLILSLVHNGHFLGMLYGDYSALHAAPSHEQANSHLQEWRNRLISVLQ